MVHWTLGVKSRFRVFGYWFLTQDMLAGSETFSDNF